MVIDGATLAYALRPPNRAPFLQLAVMCKVVVCCRATPLQKAQVVFLIKDSLKVMTLAIGDGANDVSMIQMADIGVGMCNTPGHYGIRCSPIALSQ